MQNRIKELRKALNLNQTEFGEKIGAKQATVAGWEVGRREPSPLVIGSICREFNVNENWLRTGQGEMFVEISEDEQLADFFGKIQTSDESDSIKMLMKTVAKLDDEGLQKVRDFIEIFMQKNKC